MGAVPQKPARCTAPSATCAVGFGEELLLLLESHQQKQAAGR